MLSRDTKKRRRGWECSGLLLRGSPGSGWGAVPAVASLGSSPCLDITQFYLISRGFSIYYSPLRPRPTESRGAGAALSLHHLRKALLPRGRPVRQPEPGASPSLTVCRCSGFDTGQKSAEGTLGGQAAAPMLTTPVTRTTTTIPSSLVLATTLCCGGCDYHRLHFTDEKTEAPRD